MDTQRVDHKEEAALISLRPFDLSDIDDYMVWAADERVPRFCSWDANTSKEDGIECIKNTILPHPWFRAICINNRPIGYTLITADPANRRRAEIGYVLAFSYWGKGIGTRAVKMVTSTIFNEWSHLERLEALVDAENVASQRVLEKAGFQMEAVMEKYMLLKGTSRDMVLFSFIKETSMIVSSFC